MKTALGTWQNNFLAAEYADDAVNPRNSPLIKVMTLMETAIILPDFSGVFSVISG